jgi:hypothetical protein
MRKLILAGLMVAGAACFIAVGGCTVEEPPPPELKPLPPPANPPCVRTSTWFVVCGTDFRSYRNPGFATCAGAGILHDGACLPEDGTACTPGGGSGACTWRTFCAPQYSRCVQTYWGCGKDFRTYPDQEAARQAGTELLHIGACEPGEGVACTPGAPSPGCEGELQCDPTLSRCVRPPSLCAVDVLSPRELRNYDSREHAGQEGFAILHHGSCQTEEYTRCTPGDAGLLADGGSGCAPGLECSAFHGLCVTVRYLCGTDFRTYSPPEAATDAGVPMLHPGACLPREGQPCGNPDAPEPAATLECGSGAWCERSRGVCSHPQWICGEDFKTYRFASDAEHAGVARLHEGRCLAGEGTVCVPSQDGGPSCPPDLVCDPQRELCLKP